MSVCVVLSESSEVPALVRWALHFAHGQRESLVILDATGQDAEPGAASKETERIAKVSVQEVEGAGEQSILATASRVARELCGACDAAESEPGETWPLIELWRCKWRCSPNRIIRFAKEMDTTLLVSGLHERRHPLAEPLFKSAPWRTVLIRLGGADGLDCREILVPCAGGSHSRAALQVAQGLSLANEGRMHPLYVEPSLDSPDIVAEVGEHILQRIIRKAGIPDEAPVVSRVVVSDNVTEGIRAVAGEGTFDLVLIGASNVGAIRQKLFGTVPEHLLRNSGNTAVAVIREARPIAQRVRESAERWLDLRIPQLTRDARIELFEKLQDGSRWSFDFMTLICLSTAIASLGLIQNSTAVVIGAMLVAPLMTPLLGCGLAVVQGNFPLFRSAARAIFYGFFCALAIAFLMGLIAAPMTGLTSEMAARGGPSLLDMGVAFISGVAASYCLARPKLGAALAGVAIAAALVPPIATVGISLSFGETVVARGAALLFATNVVAIVLGAAINLYAAGIRGSLKSSSQSKPLWARRAVLALVTLCVILAIPLGSSILSSVVEKKNQLLNRQLPQELRPAMMSILNPDAEAMAGAEVLVNELRRGRNPEGHAVLDVRISAPSPPDSTQLDLMARAARDFFREPVTIRVRTDLSQEVTSE